MQKAAWIRTPVEGFPPDQSRGVHMGLEILKTRIPSIMNDAKKALASVTPYYEGRMRGRVATWGVHWLPRGGFGFYYGWRKGDFTKIFYPSFVLGGTGLYGPEGKWIVPVKAKVLAWWSKHYGHRAAPKVSGQVPQDLFSKCESEVVSMITREMSMALHSGMETMKYAPRGTGKRGGWF